MTLELQPITYAEALCQEPGCGRPGLPYWVRDRSASSRRSPDRYICREHLFGQARPRRKYGNQPAMIGSESFDSQAEARRWRELLLLQQDGQIRNLVRQPRYELEPAMMVNSWQLRSVVYTADFAYTEGRQLVAEDVKGGTATVTAVWRLKSRLFKARYPQIELRVVQ